MSSFIFWFPKAGVGIIFSGEKVGTLWKWGIKNYVNRFAYFLRLWRNAATVEKSVENVENLGFSTAIGQFCIAGGPCIVQCIKPAGVGCAYVMSPEQPGNFPALPVGKVVESVEMPGIGRGLFPIPGKNFVQKHQRQRRYVLHWEGDT